MKTKRTTIALTLALIFATMPIVNNEKASAAIAQNPNALLQSMEITINTLNNDKDADTRLEVWINKSGEREAAYRDIQGQRFDDGSIHIFQVSPKTNPMTRGEIPGSWVQLRIAAERS